MAAVPPSTAQAIFPQPMSLAQPQHAASSSRNMTLSARRRPRTSASAREAPDVPAHPSQPQQRPQLTRQAPLVRPPPPPGQHLDVPCSSMSAGMTIAADGAGSRPACLMAASPPALYFGSAVRPSVSSVRSAPVTAPLQSFVSGASGSPFRSRDDGADRGGGGPERRRRQRRSAAGAPPAWRSPRGAGAARRQRISMALPCVLPSRAGWQHCPQREKFYPLLASMASSQYG